MLHAKEEEIGKRKHALVDISPRTTCSHVVFVEAISNLSAPSSCPLFLFLRFRGMAGDDGLGVYFPLSSLYRNRDTIGARQTQDQR